MYVVPPFRRPKVCGLGVPRGVVCVEVTQDDRVTLGLEKELKGGGEMRRAGGDGRNVDVVYIYGDVVDSDGDG